MKRSKVNKVIKDMEALNKQFMFSLPKFASWTPEEWDSKGSDYDEIRDNKLGWDITDYGLDNFEKVGFALFTIRNGDIKSKKYNKPYAEKILMLYAGQSAPMHFHWKKTEDIINRGGNSVFITLHNASKAGDMLTTDVTVSVDGRCITVPAGTAVELTAGESITLEPYVYHDFKVPSTGGAALLGEVSMCNDDENDNRFFETMGRFPTIEEDEPSYRLLCNEYKKA